MAIPAYQAYQERASQNSILGSLNNISKAIGACLALNAPGSCDTTAEVRIGQLTGQTLLFHTVNSTAVSAWVATNTHLCAYVSNENHRGCTGVNAVDGTVTTKVSTTKTTQPVCTTYTTQAECAIQSGCTWSGTACSGPASAAACKANGVCS